MGATTQGDDVKGTKNVIGHMGKDIKHVKNIDHTMKVDSCIKKINRLVNTKEIQIFAQTKIIG